MKAPKVQNIKTLLDTKNLDLSQKTIEKILWIRLQRKEGWDGPCQFLCFILPTYISYREFSIFN